MNIKKTMLKVMLGSGVIISCISMAQSQVLKLGNIYSPDHLVNIAIKEAAKEIKEKTEERVDIQVFPAGQIGGAKEIITGLSIGTHQMALDGAGILSQWYTPLSVFEFNYLAKDFAHLKRLTQSPKGQEIIDTLREKNGMRLLDVWYYGTREMTNNTRPVNSLADLKGIKMRAPEIRLSVETAKALGVNPTVMAYTEVYLGLQTGVVSGVETTLPSIYSAKFYEVQKYLAMTDHQVQFLSPIIAEDVWQSISPEDQKVMIDVLHKAGEKYNQQVVKQESELVKDFEKEGLVVTYPDKKEMKAALAGVPKLFEKQWGKGTYEALSKVE